MVHRLGGVVAALLTSCVLTASPSGRVSTQQPAMADVLARAAQSVTAFADPSRLIVCEESYKHTFLRLMVNAAGQIERLPQGGHEWTAKKWRIVPRTAK